MKYMKDLKEVFKIYTKSKLLTNVATWEGFFGNNFRRNSFLM
jgi:hypothetical protein